jgi:tetratricopeptide (TPR) repeat protein
MKLVKRCLVLFFVLFYIKSIGQTSANFKKVFDKFPLNGTYLQKKTYLRHIYDSIREKEDNALEYYYLNSSIKFLNERSETLLEAIYYYNLGLLYKKFSKYNEAMSNYIYGEKLLNNLSPGKANPDDVKRALNLLYLGHGNNYYFLDAPDKAMGFYMKALKVLQSIDKLNKSDSLSITQAYTNIGIINGVKENYPTALIYFRLALSLNVKLKDTSGIAHVLSNLATIHSYNNELDSALNIRLKVKEIYERSNDKEEIAYINTEISKLYSNKNDYKKALSYALVAIDNSDTTIYSEGILDAYKILHHIYYELGDYKMENKYLKLYMAVRDSVNKDQTLGEINQVEMQNSFNTIRLTDSIKAVEEIKLKDLKISEKRTQTYFLIVTLLFTIIALTLIYSRFKLTKKQKVIIEEKNKEITDSITYAKKIQNSIMPNESYIAKELKRLNEKKNG